MEITEEMLREARRSMGLPEDALFPPRTEYDNEDRVGFLDDEGRLIILPESLAWKAMDEIARRKEDSES